jgi:Transposase IS200 like
MVKAPYAANRMLSVISSLFSWAERTNLVPEGHPCAGPLGKPTQHAEARSDMIALKAAKGRSSHRVQMEFPDLRKRYWGRHFWARGYFSTTSGNITDDVISYFSIFRSTKLPASAGSYSVICVWILT